MSVELVPFHPVEHSSLVRRWLSRPHVMRWWGDLEKEFPDVIEDDRALGRALIAADGRPVGYLQWQPYSESDVEIIGPGDVPAGAVDVDIMIGEEDAVGRGVGPRALGLLLEILFKDPLVPAVGVAPSVENVAAVRAYEKAGFQRQCLYDDPEWGPCWFYLARRVGTSA